MFSLQGGLVSLFLLIPGLTSFLDNSGSNAVAAVIPAESVISEAAISVMFGW